MRASPVRKRLLALFLFSVALQPSFLAAQNVVVTEGDITRQPEGTPPSDNWVGYTRLGTPPTAIMFMNGPANPPMGCGSVQLSTLAPSTLR